MSEYTKPTVTPEDEPSTYGITWHDSDIVTEVEFAAEAFGVIVLLVAPD